MRKAFGFCRELRSLNTVLEIKKLELNVFDTTRESNDIKRLELAVKHYYSN